MQIRTVAIVPIAIAALFALTGCGGAPAPEPTGTSDAAPSASPTPSETPAARVFTMPTDCSTVLPESRQQDFASKGLVLLGGPGGQYEHYYADPTPEELQGGITCIWGDDDVPSSTVTVSVAPLDASSRGLIVDNLLAQGLNEATVDDGISYAQLGDENSAPAVLNILRDDSWISVIEALGGEAFFDEAVELAGEAATQVYSS
jgi:hypothetical protein